MERYYLGFDAGTQSVKAAVYDEKWNCVAQDSHATMLTYPKPGWVEMDADQYLDAALKSITGCVQQMQEKGMDVGSIRAICGDGVIEGIVGVNEAGQAITPYINYLDSRTKEDAAELTARGLSIWAEETGNPQPSCMFPAMFARWLMQNDTAFQKAGKKFMHNAPYILSRLADLKAQDAFIDWGAMSGWGLGYKVMEKTWSPKQLEILGIPEAYMPRICKPWDIIGHLCEKYAAQTGLPAGIPICAGAGDTMQSMIGCGVTQANKAADVAGTCAMFCLAVDGIKPELSRPEYDLVFNSGTMENTYFYWGFIRTGGLALRWFKDNVCHQEENPDYFNELTARAEKIAPGANGVLFLPYLTGGFGEISQASSCFLNMSMDTDQAVMWRAVLEAIGYDYIAVTDNYRKAGLNLDVITVTEGGSKSGLWNQIKADMMGSQVVTLKTAEGAVLTNAMTAAYAVGDLPDLKEAFEKSLDVKQVYQPRPENTAYYRAVYEKKSKLVKEHMAAAFGALHEIGEIPVPGEK